MASPASETRLAFSQASALGWAVAILVLVQSVFFLPNDTLLSEKTAFLVILGSLGLPFLFATAFGLIATEDKKDSRRAARFALGFLLWAGVSAVFAAGTESAVFGLYLTQTGWFFFLFMAGAWALCTRLSSYDRRLLEFAIIAAAAWNGALSFIEVHISTVAIGLPLYQGQQPIGTLDNPVFAGALMAAALALVIPRFVRAPLMWSPVVMLIGLGLGTGGERLPVILALILLAGELLVAARRSRRLGEWGVSSLWLGMWSTILVTLMTLGTTVVGSVTSRTGLVRHIAATTSSETFGDRLNIWDASWHAALHRPLVGYGPDQFLSATLAHYPSSLIHESVVNVSQATVFADAHDFIVELMVTVGFVGVLLFLGWLLFSLRRRSGPLLVFALILLATELAEPLHPGITPLAFIALGAASVRRNVAADDLPERFPRLLENLPRSRLRSANNRPHWLRAGSWALGILAIAPAVVLVVGDVALVSGLNANSQSANAVADASTAETLLSPWPQPALLQEILAVQRHQFLQAMRWAQVAVNRDPGNPSVIVELSALQFINGDFRAGRQTAAMAVREQPWNTIGLDLLGAADQVQGRLVQARRLYRQSLALYSDQGDIHELLSGKCSPSLPGSDPANPLSFGCKTKVVPS